MCEDGGRGGADHGAPAIPGQPALPPLWRRPRDQQRPYAYGPAAVGVPRLCPDVRPTFGTPLYRLHTPAPEVARSLLMVMRRGSLSAAEEITGHKYETLGRWLRAAAAHAEALTAALVHDVHLSAVEVDALWSFVKRSAATLEATTPRRPGWGRAGAA